MLGGKYYDIENPYKAQDEANVLCRPATGSGKHRWSMLRTLIVLVAALAFVAVFVGTLRYGQHGKAAVRTGCPYSHHAVVSDAFDS